MSDRHRPEQETGPRQGRFVVIVGPDGVGKTTVARALVAAAGPPTGYFHFRPLVFSPILDAPPASMDPAIDKGSSAGSRLLGWIRIGRNLVRFWAGYLLRVRPAIAGGALVIGDRWAYGYLVQPAALKFYGPTWLARLALRLLPEPDLVANLTAPVDVVRDRKQELSPAEISAELGAWTRIPARHLRGFDTQGRPDEIAARILQELGW
jgi:energy-coupling factor transporter ATP-binding protein EcfA2